MQDTATLVTAWAALFTGVATLLVVWEMRRQRHSSLLPDLEIHSANFEVILREKSPEGWLIVQNPPGGRARYVALGIENLGVGTAKSVKLSWQIDLQAMVDRLAELGALSASARIWIEPWGVKFEDLSGGKNVILTAREEDCQTLRALAPASTASDFRVPGAYLEVFGQYLYWQMKRDSDDSWYRSKLIEDMGIEVELSYRGVTGKHYKKRYQILPRLTEFTRHPEMKYGDGESVAKGYFEVAI